MMALGRGSGGGTAALTSLFPEQPAETLTAMIMAATSIKPFLFLFVTIVSRRLRTVLLDDDRHLRAFVREVAGVSRQIHDLIGHFHSFHDFAECRVLPV